MSVACEPHECPSDDLAGWRRERLSHPPDGVIDLPPDWVCEIVSPGHEKKDTVTLPLLLQRHRVPWLWLIWPEDRALIAHELDGHSYQVIATLKEPEQGRARIPALRCRRAGAEPGAGRPAIALAAAQQGSAAERLREADPAAIG